MIEGGGWHHLNLPAIAQRDTSIELTQGRVHAWAEGAPLQAAREPVKILDDLKRTMGAREFSAQYLQKLVPQGGNVIKLKYFPRIDLNAPRGAKPVTVLSIDTASSERKTADYSVIQIWEIRDKCYCLIGSTRGQWDYPTLKAKAIELSKSLNRPRILVEEAGVGFALFKELRAEGCNPVRITPKGSKEQRLSEVLPVIESERVSLPNKAPWLEDLEAELASFPAGRNDDQVDTMTQFLKWAEAKRPTPVKLPQIRLVQGGRMMRV